MASHYSRELARALQTIKDAGHMTPQVREYLPHVIPHDGSNFPLACPPRTCLLFRIDLPTCVMA
jgi:hypothetical protein